MKSILEKSRSVRPLASVASVFKDLLIPSNSEALQRECGDAHRALDMVLSSGHLQPKHVQGRVIDFGCGIGTSTLLLLRSGADVVGVDARSNKTHLRPSWEDTKALAAFEKANLVPNGRILITDGLQYLNELPKNSVDLVTSFMFGPDHIDGCPFFRNFLSAARQVLKPDGKILVTSDQGTIEMIWNFVEPSLLDRPFLWIGGNSSGG